MKLPCGACGKYVPGMVFTTGCFFCWGAKHGKYGNYWEDADQIPEPRMEVMPEPVHEYKGGHNPYYPDHSFSFSPSVPVDPPNQTVPPETVFKPAPRTIQCIHLGPENGDVLCPTCSGKVMVKTFDCAVYGTCTIAKRVGEMACCDHGRCQSFTTSPAPA